MTVRAPSGLAAAGRRLWRDVLTAYDLRPDERVVLEQACRTLDDTVVLSRSLAAAEATVPGSAGQPRPNPLFSQVRASRALLAKLLAQLGLPDNPAEEPVDTSTKARRAARARWEARFGNRSA